jgi:hypothetical protein
MQEFEPPSVNTEGGWMCSYTTDTIHSPFADFPNEPSPVVTLKTLKFKHYHFAPRFTLSVLSRCINNSVTVTRI